MSIRFLALAVTAAAAAAVAISSFGAGSDSAAGAARDSAAGQRAECVPVARAECGSVRVPLFRSRPAGAMIDVGYALIRHSDRSLPAAAGTVVVNPGGPGVDVVRHARELAGQLGGLLPDHDLLLVDPRGTGRSGPIVAACRSCPRLAAASCARSAACRRALGARARAYTSAATADDVEAVRAQLGIARLDLLGLSYGTYLMAV